MGESYSEIRNMDVVKDVTSGIYDAPGIDVVYGGPGCDASQKHNHDALYAGIGGSGGGSFAYTRIDKVGANGVQQIPPNEDWWEFDISASEYEKGTNNDLLVMKGVAWLYRGSNKDYQEDPSKSNGEMCTKIWVKGPITPTNNICFLVKNSNMVDAFDINGDSGNAQNVRFLQARGNTDVKVVASQVNPNTGKFQFSLQNQTSGIPPGVIVPYAALQFPSGWRLCNGGALSKTTYSDLYAVIGTHYGGSSTTFNVPNLRDRVPACIGSYSGMNVLGETGGARTHTLSASEMPKHRHSITMLIHGDNNGSYPERGSSSVSGTSYTGYQGSSYAHNNLQPYITLQYIIKC